MSSPMKDALTEFINNNSSEIEQAMENGSHAKDEPVISDLMNYLSCPTPQPSSKDTEPMSMNEKAEAHNSAYNTVELQMSQQSHFGSSQILDTSAGGQFSSSQVCAPSNENSYRSEAPVNLSHQDLHQQHCLDHIDSFDKSSSLFLDTNLHTGLQNAQIANPSVFESVSCNNNSEGQNMSSAAIYEPQYCHDGHISQFEASSSTNSHYHHIQQAHLHSTDNCVGQFQNQSEADTNCFQVSSLIDSSFPSVTSEVSYGCNQDGLGFAMNDVSPKSLNNLENVTSQLKSPEKMHVDEPESTYQQTESSKNIDHYQAASLHISGSSDVHMQSYSAKDFPTQSDLDTVQPTSAVADSDLVDCSFKQANTSVIHTTDEFAASGIAPPNTVHSPATFDISRDAYQSSVSSSFRSQNFHQNPAVLQVSAEVDFQGNSSLAQTKDIITNPSHYLDQQSEMSGSPEAPFSNHSKHSYISSQPSPYQSSQYHDSPDHCNASQNIPDSFQKSFIDANISTSSPGFNQPHNLHQNNNVDSSFQSLKNFQHSPAVDIHCTTNTSLSQCPDQQSVGFQNNVESSLNASALFPSLTSVGSQHEQKDYLSNSVHPPSSQVNDPSAFIGYSSVGDPLLTDMCTSVNQASVSQNLTDYEMSASPGQGHALTDSSKTSSDVTMRDFSSGGNLHASSHSGFTDDSDSFSQLDLVAVVSSLRAETNTSTTPQNESIMSTVSYDPHYSNYEFNKLTSSSVSFPGLSNTTEETNSNFTFNEQCQTDPGLVSCTSTLATTTLPLDRHDQNTGSHFVPSSFNLTSTSEVTSQSYHQPMQVQDSESHASYSFNSPHIANNTETAMDVSSNFGDKGRGFSSSISYEEIHMSIVEAGNALSKKARDAIILDSHIHYDSSQAQTTRVNSVSSVSDTYSTPPSDMFHTDKSGINSVESFIAASQNSFLTAPSAASETVQNQNSFNSEAAAHSSSVSTADVIANDSVDSNIFSSILNNLQVSSSQPHHQEEIAQQASVTIPNFLETPGTVGSHSHTNPDDPVLTNSIAQGQPLNTFVITMASTTPGSCKNLVDTSAMNQPQVGGMHREGMTSQQQVLSSTVSQEISTSVHHSQMCGSVMNSTQASSSSFFGQPEPDVVDLTGRTDNLSSSQVVQASVDSVSRSSSGVFLQLAPHQADNKTTNVSSGFASTIKMGTNQQQKSSTNINLSGLTLGSVPTGNPSPVLSNSSTKQPQIIVSLEDLQKLLAQQNLSHPSPSVHQQQPYTTLSSPQTLVLQKHASHSLKQSQPRLLIRGATLTSQPRSSHPHQQLQNTREKLQLLMHQAQPSEHVPTGTIPQRISEPMTSSAPLEIRQKISNPFQFVSFGQQDQQSHQKLNLLKQTADHQPRVQLQLKQNPGLHHQQQTVNLFLQQVPKTGEQKLAPLQLLGPQHLVIPQGQQQSQTDQKSFIHSESQSHLPQNVSQKGQNVTQKADSGIQLARMQQELLLLLKQQEKAHEFEEQQLRQFHLHHQHHLQPLEKTDRPCSESLKKDYKQLHSLLTGETTGAFSNLPNTQAKVLPPVLNLPTNPQGQSSLHLTNTGAPTASSTPAQSLSSVTQISTAPFSFMSLNNNSSMQLTNSCSTQSSAAVTTLTFVKTPSASAISKAFDAKDAKIETNNINCQSSSLHAQYFVKPESGSLEKNDLDNLVDHSGHQASSLVHISTERKRSHTPLSVDLNSPANSSSEAGSPLSSPTAFEDGNTQLTLIERSADLQIKSDSMHGVDDDDDNDNASFDVNAFHKRPSADEFHSPREKNESVPMKIAKPSIGADAHSGANPSTSPEPTFDFGGAVTSASSFSFAFGNKEDNNSDVFTFGLSGTAATTTVDTQLHKDVSRYYRLTSTKPVMKAVGIRSSVPTQPVRPLKKQKEYSLKAYYPSKLDCMELKILQQPEPQHRARYQTEGSRGAIKDASQQGFPTVKLFGYNKPATLQVFIGDECGRVKPHGFYQACRVFGKNSTTCVEQEIEDTTVIEIEMLPESDMTVKLDCVGILKLRNADVERRIGPKRAREKKKTNTRARLVMRCLVGKADGSQQILQVVSNPIVCTQPVGQPEISRLSLTEASVLGGDSLFIIGKNFKNKGTSVLFQKLDSNEEDVVWQMEAEIEHEFFQPTHLICKIPPYTDQSVEKPQLAQIVVSCAGKRSDPHNFTYKPVYPVAPSMKQEMPMDTDNTLSTRSMSFVSPEALHLNRMVQLTNAHSVPATTAMFQLPQGTIPAMTAAESSTTAVSSQLIKPGKLVNHTSTQATMVVMTPTTSESTGLATEPRPPREKLLATSASSPALQSFLLEEKNDGLMPRSLKDSPSVASALPVSINDGAEVKCIVHSNSDTSTDSPMSYTISDIHPQPSLTSSISAGQMVAPSDTQPSEIKLSSSSSASSLPFKPFFVVVDPAALQSRAEGDKSFRGTIPSSVVFSKQCTTVAAAYPGES